MTQKLQVAAGILGLLLLLVGFVAFYTGTGYGWFFTALGAIALTFAIFTNAIPSWKK